MDLDCSIRVGPAGWSYDDWKGVVYPNPMPSGVHALELLCTWFDTVEVNSSFYRPPNPRHCESWVAKVASNPRFRFTAKLWQGFTHGRESWPDEKDIAAFKAGLGPLQESGRLGAVLVQFPWSFRRTDENRRWLGRIVETFDAWPLVVEVRHTSWDRSEVYAGFKEKGVAFCNIDQPVLRDCLEPSEHVTAPVGYVRLHGRNRENWFREDAGRNARYDYLYSAAELKPWIEKVHAIRKEASEIYVITNNHYRGQAVVNAFELEHGFGRREITIPAQLIDAYPRLRGLLQEPRTAS